MGAKWRLIGSVLVLFVQQQSLLSRVFWQVTKRTRRMRLWMSLQSKTKHTKESVMKKMCDCKSVFVCSKIITPKMLNV